MPSPTAFEASIRRGAADPACPETIIPVDLREALAKWRASGAANHDEVMPIIAKYMTANFVPENVDVLDEIMHLSGDVEAERVEVQDFRMGEGDSLPSVSATAFYTLNLLKPLSQDELSDWQDEQGEYLTDCVNFFWSFEDPEGNWCNVFGDHEGAGMGIAE